MHNDWTDAKISEAWGTHPNSINNLKMRWGDPTQVLVGEWGLSQQMLGPTPGGKIQHMHDALGSRATAALFYLHPASQEGADLWGLHHVDDTGPELLLGPEIEPTHSKYVSAVGP